MSPKLPRPNGPTTRAQRMLARRDAAMRRHKQDLATPIPETRVLVRELSEALSCALYIISTDINSAAAEEWQERCKNKHGIEPGLGNRAAAWLAAE